MKKTPLKRKSKTPIRTLQNKIWELCKQIIRLKYGNVCYTCGKTGLVGSDWHTGHMIPDSVCGAFLRYDLRNLRPQCYNCNINRGGMGAVFHRKMLMIEGKKYVEQLFRDKQRSVKAYDHYILLVPIYTDILAKLSTPKDL